jgi:hypothetical protein
LSQKGEIKLPAIHDKLSKSKECAEKQSIFLLIFYISCRLAKEKIEAIKRKAAAIFPKIVEGISRNNRKAAFQDAPLGGNAEPTGQPTFSSWPISTEQVDLSLYGK